MIDFNNKHILVVGASSGIGRQTAIQLSNLGARLTLLSRREQELQKTVSLLNVAMKHSYYPFNLTNIDGICNKIKQIIEEKGSFDGMVYTAGVVEDVPITNLDNKRLMRTFNTNYFAFIECVRQVTKKNRYNEGCRIVAVSSVASLLGEKAHTAYSASKAAMDAAVRCIAKELAMKGICINTVAPAMIKTPMYDTFIDMNDAEGDANTRTLQRQYLGLGEPQDVANAICFLLSSAARFITGVTLPVDGGFTTSC